jgi:uncharacterized protein (DUF302 family)
MIRALGALALAAFVLFFPPDARSATDGDKLPGWAVSKTAHGYKALIERLDNAVKANKMGLVTRASATAGAASLGKTIPGNMVVGVYRPDFAIRMLEASVPAGIEAPIRFYITENADGTATLSYKKPSAVFAPYADGGGKLKALAAELDGIFARIAREATAP